MQVQIHVASIYSFRLIISRTSNDNHSCILILMHFMNHHRKHWKRTIFPSSFIGGCRDMTQRYEDGMTIVLNDGKPYIFLIMTCNPSWSEITSELFPFQTQQDRPDLLTRIFRSKFEQLKDDVINK